MEENIKQISGAISIISRMSKEMHELSSAFERIGNEALAVEMERACNELSIAFVDLEQVSYRLNEVAKVPSEAPNVSV